MISCLLWEEDGMGELVINNSFAVAHGKGGSGKTHVAVNFSANEAAAISAGTPDDFDRQHKRVILVDLDPQANAGGDLGIATHDEGKSISATALGFIERPTLYETGRENLYYVAGGSELIELATIAQVKSKGNPKGLATMLAKALAPLNDDQTLFVFDTPPATGSPLSDAALQIGQWMAIPTPIDQRSLDGVGTLLERILDTDSDIKPVGVILFDIDPQATSINRQAAQYLSKALDGAFPILKSSIRHANKAQSDSRRVGLTAAEYAQFAAQEFQPWYEQIKLPSNERLTFAANAPAVAADYHQLHQEIIATMFNLAKGPQGE